MTATAYRKRTARGCVERFVRLDAARSRDQGGAGLGLAVVAETANRFGGQVSISQSALGGARFEIQLQTAN